MVERIATVLGVALSLALGAVVFIFIFGSMFFSAFGPPLD